MERTKSNMTQKNMMLMKWILVVSVALFIIFLAVERASIGCPYNPKSPLTDPFDATEFKGKILLLQKNRSSIRLLFVGDSIFELYESPESYVAEDISYEDVWKHYYGDRGAVNLGFAGDDTANLLWRIQAGEIDGLSPSLVVLLIGANNIHKTFNLNLWSAESDVRGIEAAVRELHLHMPNAHILLVGILPAGDGQSAWKKRGFARWRAQMVSTINEKLAEQFDHGDVPYVTYVDLTSVFLRNGRVDNSLFIDGIHPTVKGQAMMASALEPLISNILGDKPKGTTVVKSVACGEIP
jgi:lysophospholipase L1-like esterase